MNERQNTVPGTTPETHSEESRGSTRPLLRLRTKIHGPRVSDRSEQSVVIILPSVPPLRTGLHFFERCVDLNQAVPWCEASKRPNAAGRCVFSPKTQTTGATPALLLHLTTIRRFGGRNRPWSLSGGSWRRSAITSPPSPPSPSSRPEGGVEGEKKPSSTTRDEPE